jgi:hypothetical protein
LDADHPKMRVNFACRSTFPWFGIETGLAEHLTIGLLFLIVSLLRSYLLRRLFERHRALR